MAGGLWFYFLGQAFPQFAFDPLFDLAIVLMAFFGGLGTVAGPVLGALVLEPVQLYLTLQLTNDYLSEILLGVAVPGDHLVHAARRAADGRGDHHVRRARRRGRRLRWRGPTGRCGGTLS